MNMKEMNKSEQLEQILFDFVKRVTEGKTISDTEIQVLPEIAKVLKDSLQGI